MLENVYIFKRTHLYGVKNLFLYNELFYFSITDFEQHGQKEKSSCVNQQMVHKESGLGYI